MNEEALAPIVWALFRPRCCACSALPNARSPPSHPLPPRSPRGGEINLLVSRLTVEINCWNLVPSKCYIPVQDINITNLKEPKWLHNGALSACMTLVGHTKLACFHNWKFSRVPIFQKFFSFSGSRFLLVTWCLFIQDLNKGFVIYKKPCLTYN